MVEVEAEVMTGPRTVDMAAADARDPDPENEKEIDARDLDQDPEKDARDLARDPEKEAIVDGPLLHMPHEYMKIFEAV